MWAWSNQWRPKSADSPKSWSGTLLDPWCLVHQFYLETRGRCHLLPGYGLGVAPVRHRAPGQKHTHSAKFHQSCPAVPLARPLQMVASKAALVEGLGAWLPWLGWQSRAGLSVPGSRFQGLFPTVTQCTHSIPGVTFYPGFFGFRVWAVESPQYHYLAPS